jgi:hypothetical protein
MKGIKEQTIYREPGLGALKYTRQCLSGLSREESLAVIEELLRGELNDPSDNRVKRCDYCGYFWRDDSVRNTKKTCCDGCKTGIKTLQRRDQRANKELLNPEKKEKKHTLMDDYVWWIEYPFWLHEYSMIKIGWKFERPSGIALMDYVDNKRSTYGSGNSRKSVKHVSYHGDDRDLF